MKRSIFAEIKLLKTEEIKKKVNSLRIDLEEAVLNKNMRKLKNVRSVSKIKKDIARVLTILGQKELLEKLKLDKGESKK